MRTSQKAFTLIELLVVISIIAILVGAAFPIYNTVTKQAQQSKNLQQCKGIFTGLKAFAIDHDGTFPAQKDIDFVTPPATAADANDLLANLVPNYIGDEKPFSNSLSAWCKVGGAYTPPANDFSARANVLKPGENTWAYISGFSDSSNALYPIIADGFAGGSGAGAGADPVYATDPSVKGGVWDGKKAIVIRCDGAGNLESVRSDLKVHLTYNGVDQSMFAKGAGGGATTPWLAGGTVWNPK